MKHKKMKIANSRMYSVHVNHERAIWQNFENSICRTAKNRIETKINLTKPTNDNNDATKKKDKKNRWMCCQQQLQQNTECVDAAKAVQFHTNSRKITRHIQLDVWVRIVALAHTKHSIRLHQHKHNEMTTLHTHTRAYTQTHLTCETREEKAKNTENRQINKEKCDVEKLQTFW